MAEREAGETPDGELPASTPTGELPAVEAPPLSPAGESSKALVITAQPAEAIASLRRHLKPRHKRRALLAASVALAAGFGAAIGTLAATWSPPTHDAAGLEERQAMQRSISHLSKQVALLKADLRKAGKATHVRSAKAAERHDPIVTGSIPKVGQAVAVPLPRPAPHIAAVASRPAVVADWRVHDVRDGYVFVQGHGDIYQVVPGAPLPGLGPVQSITRRNGRWVVTTPRGIIVSRRARRFFN